MRRAAKRMRLCRRIFPANLPGNIMAESDVMPQTPPCSRPGFAPGRSNKLLNGYYQPIIRQMRNATDLGLVREPDHGPSHIGHDASAKASVAQGA